MTLLDSVSVFVTAVTSVERAARLDDAGTAWGARIAADVGGHRKMPTGGQ